MDKDRNAARGVLAWLIMILLVSLSLNQEVASGDGMGENDAGAKLEGSLLAKELFESTEAEDEAVTSELDEGTASDWVEEVYVSHVLEKKIKLIFSLHIASIYQSPNR